jgi:hypothetical protein
MPINFANLVLRPCEDTFAIAITVDPIGSRPGRAPYTFRGIWTSKAFEVMSMDGGVLSDHQTTIGIRLADIDDGGAPPAARDIVTVQPPAEWKWSFEGQRFLVDDLRPDGQGGAVMQLRKIAPDYPQ